MVDMYSVKGQEFENVDTKERKVADRREGRLIYFEGDDSPYGADDWQVAYPASLKG